MENWMIKVQGILASTIQEIDKKATITIENDYDRPFTAVGTYSCCQLYDVTLIPKMCSFILSRDLSKPPIT